MSAYSELCETGQLGEDGVRLLYATVRRVAHRFPPQGGGSWNADQYVEAAHDFLVNKGARALTALLVRATDDDSFERLFAQTVLNYFRSEARKTEVGKLRRRLLTVLREDTRFVAAGLGNQPDRRWSMRELNDSLEYTGSIDPLVSAAWDAAGVSTARWRSSTRSYFADRGAIAEFARVVLTTAGGPLDIDRLVDVAVQRFDLTDPPLVVDFQDTTYEYGEAANTAESDVEWVWAQLTEQERSALVHIDSTVREAAAALGIGRTAAAILLRRTKEVLSQTVGEDGAALLRIQELAHERTDGSNRAS